MWTKEYLRHIVMTPQFTVSSVSVLSFASGAALSYLLFEKRVETKYEQLAEHEIAKARRFYSALNSKPDLKDLARKSDKLDEAVTALKDYSGEGETVVAVNENEAVVIHTEPQPERHNIFTDAQPAATPFVLATEMRNRTEDAPYVLSREEYFEGERDYQQNTVTYFEGDDVLVDERDQMIPDTDSTVGELNLKKFGYGSEDPNIVYIRNDVLAVDFEVVRSMGDYAKEVLGFQHSDRPGSRKNRRFRDDDG